MEEKRNVPKLRFPGFTDPWEQRKLGEVVDVRGGKDYKHLKPGPIPVYGTGGLMTYVDDALSKNEDAVGIGRKGTIDQPYKLHAPFWTVDTLFYAVPKTGNDIEFVLCCFQRINWKAKDESTGLPSLSKSAINDTRLLTPRLGEQSRIGALFAKLDSLIALHQRKLDHVKELKKGLLQKVFPKEGANVPELRFPGFTDPWEQRKLGEVATVTMGQSPNGAFYTDNPNDIILVQGNADLKDGWVCPKVWTTQITKTANAGDLIISVRAPVGAVGKTAFDVVLGRGVAGIEGDEFLYQALQKKTQDGYWAVVSAGSTFDSISGNELKNTPIPVPSSSVERAKVGEQLRKLDSLIALHQRELDHVKELKKGLLQQMFV